MNATTQTTSPASQTVDQQCNALATAALSRAQLAYACASETYVDLRNLTKLHRGYVIAIADRIEAIRTQEADEYDDMLASFYACHPAD